MNSPFKLTSSLIFLPNDHRGIKVNFLHFLNIFLLNLACSFTFTTITTNMVFSTKPTYDEIIFQYDSYKDTECWHLITAAGKPQLFLILISNFDSCGHQLMISKCLYSIKNILCSLYSSNNKWFFLQSVSYAIYLWIVLSNKYVISVICLMVRRF